LRTGSIDAILPTDACKGTGMKLSRREDVEAPLPFVWAMLSDVDQWERAALRRGAEVQRLDTLTETAPGMGWQLRFPYRGKPRKLTLRLAEMETDARLGFTAVSPNVQGTAGIDLVEMGPKRTRITVQIEVTPRTLAARLFLQGLRLARGRVEKRFADRIAQLAADIEDRFRRKPQR
jgi:carbon monoxide dehydrogenase subunit G